MDYFELKDRQEEMWEALSELSGEQVLRYLTCWYGMELLDEEFYKFLVDEGVIPEEEEEEEEE
jgi:hypothetical protein